MTAQVFSDLPCEEGEAWARKLVKHSVASFASPLTYSGYKDVPVFSLVCEDYLSISVETKRSQVEMIEWSSSKVDVMSINSGHVPPVIHPNGVIRWILQAASRYA